MKGYTEDERKQYLENWKNRPLLKSACAKSADLHPITFYTWMGMERKRRKTT